MRCSRLSHRRPSPPAPRNLNPCLLIFCNAFCPEQNDDEERSTGATGSNGVGDDDDDDDDDSSSDNDHELASCADSYMYANADSDSDSDSCCPCGGVRLRYTASVAAKVVIDDCVFISVISATGRPSKCTPLSGLWIRLYYCF